MRQQILIFAGIIGFIAGMIFMLQGLGGILAFLSAILVAGVRLVPDKHKKGDPEA